MCLHNGAIRALGKTCFCFEVSVSFITEVHIFIIEKRSSSNTQK